MAYSPGVKKAWLRNCWGKEYHNDMKAIRAHKWCQPRDLVMDDIECPRPGEGEALIKIESAALNFPDLLLIAGKYQVKPPLPFSPGLEVAGTIEEIAGNTRAIEPGWLCRICSCACRGSAADALPYDL
jgi:NADPH:quinone reductase-like Zn-dependent oxidoreductase